MNEDGITELSKQFEPLHLTVNVQLILSSDVQTVDCLPGVRLDLQLEHRDTQE